MAPAARPLKRRPSSSARVAGRCWTSVSGASLGFHAHRHLFAARFGGLERAEMIHRPIGKHRAAVNKLAGNGTEDARIVGADPVVPKNEETVFGHARHREVAAVFVLRRNVGLWNDFSVDVERPLADFYGLPISEEHTSELQSPV